jgi:peptide/nickel transport system permease protein
VPTHEPAIHDIAVLADGRVVAADLVDEAHEAEDGGRRRRIDVGLWLAVGWMALIIFFAVFATVLPLQDPLALNPRAARQSPSWDHWLGTDNLSRDMLSRTAHGARVSLLVGFVSAGIAAIVGSFLGLIAGYQRKLTETLIMGWMDIMLAAPALLLVIVLTSFLGPTLRNVILAISVLSVPAFARIARAQTLAVSEREFVKAAKTLGATRRRIIFREIAPNIAPTVAAYFLVTVSVAIVLEGSLSFLGLGLSRERPTWGGMINDGRTFLGTSLHITLIPALAMFLTVLSLNSLGEKILRRQQHRRGATT